MPRTKRAAAVLAETKIKRVVEDVVNQEDEAATIAFCTLHSEPRPVEPSDSMDLFDFDNDASKKKQRRSNTMTNDGQKRSSRYSVEPSTSDSSRSSLSSISTTLSGFGSLGDFLYSPGYSGAPLFDSDFSSLEDPGISDSARKQRIRNQWRRSRNSINSTGPMLLSHRYYHRMSSERASPQLSPICAARLQFSPVAHLQTTPVFDGVARGRSVVRSRHQTTHRRVT